jgi:hypothetical protein
VSQRGLEAQTVAAKGKHLPSLSPSSFSLTTLWGTEGAMLEIHTLEIQHKRKVFEWEKDSLDLLDFFRGPVSIAGGIIYSMGTRGGAVGWATALRARKVAGFIADGVIGIFHWLNPSGRTVALRSTQPLTEMSTRNKCWG